jgi:hypothetical protein
MKLYKLAASAALLLSAMFAIPQRADAWAFYWSKVEVKTSSWQTCMNFAYGEAQRQHLTQIQRNNLDVNGKLNGSVATITCVGTGGNSRAMAIVMVVGDADAPVRQLRDALVTGITRVQLID